MILSSLITAVFLLYCVESAVDNTRKYDQNTERYIIRSTEDGKVKRNSANVNLDKFIPYVLFPNESNVDNSHSGGLPTPPGLFTYLVAFVLKPGFQAKHEISGVSTDHSVERFLCTGTLLNKRWILSKAKPLVYYRYKDYSMIAPRHFSLFDLESLNKFDVNWVEYYKKYEIAENLEFDIALVRTTKNIDFNQELRPVNLGLPTPKSKFNYCDLVVWNWTRNENDTTIISRATIPIRLLNEKSCHLARSYSPGDYSQHFSCIVQTEEFRRFDEPCAINLGAPIVCDAHQLYGIYVGYRGKSECKDSFKNEYEAINIYATNTTILQWIEAVLNNNLVDNDKDILQRFDDDFNAMQIDRLTTESHRIFKRDQDFNETTNFTENLIPLFAVCGGAFTIQWHIQNWLLSISLIVKIIMQ